MNLQYQLSNGNWADCGDREVEFIERSVGKRINAVSTFAEAVVALNAGRKLSTGSDWYANIRVRPEPVAPRVSELRQVLRCVCCGQAGHRGEYPFSTAGSSTCDDCV